MERKIILNRIKCNICEDIIISHSRHDFIMCKCGRVSVDGGKEYLKRGFVEFSDFTNMNVYSDDSFEIIRENFYFFKSYDKEKEQFQYEKLSESSTSHIKDCIFYKKSTIQIININI